MAPCISSAENGEKQEKIGNSGETVWGTLTSCRWLLSYMSCLCITLSTALKANLGLAIVCMIREFNTTGNGDFRIFDNGLNQTIQQLEMNPEVWSKSLQGTMLGALFFGYIVTQIPGGYLAGRFGGKIVVLVSMFILGVTTLLIPVAARFDGGNSSISAYLVIALRVITGLVSTQPAILSLWGRWAPPLERSMLIVFSNSGIVIGSVLMLVTGGFFCEWTSFDGGWPSMFYIGGGLCLLFCPLWYFTVYDSPLEHPRISDQEKKYIIFSLGHEDLEDDKEKPAHTVPWKAIFTSPAVWAIIVASFCSNFGAFTLLTKLPAFMKEVLGFNISQNGLYSSLPYVSQFVVANITAQVIDQLRKRNIVSTVICRKVCMTGAFVIPASILLGIGFITPNMQALGVALLALAVGFQGFERAACWINHVDIAPRYAGELMGIANTFSTIPGTFAPSLVNAMTPTGSVEEWRNVFYVWAGVYVFGAVFYAIFARGSVRDWSLDTNDETKKESNLSTDSLPREKIFVVEDFDDTFNSDLKILKNSLCCAKAVHSMKAARGLA